MGRKNSGPALYDTSLLLAAGIDPVTGLPIKYGVGPCSLKPDIKRYMRIIDEQDAINRFTWEGLPYGINGQLVERMLYYKGQLCFFYFEEIDQFVITPYTLDGTLDFYGRFRGIRPVPWFNVTESSSKEEKAEYERQRVLLSSKHLIPLYDEITAKKLIEEGPSALSKYCVILKDYTEQISQTIIPRSTLNDSILDVEAECIPFMRTALIRSTGVKGMRVGNPDEYKNVSAANNSMLDAALTGKVNIPILGQVDFQELNDGTVGKADEFMMALQSLDNFRLSGYGLDNGGLFQKKQHMLQSEQEMNAAGGGSIGLIMQDGLSNRQRFCDIVNSLWGLGFDCYPSETVSGTDRNLDGELSDQKQPKNAAGGEQPSGGMNDEA